MGHDIEADLVLILSLIMEAKHVMELIQKLGTNALNSNLHITLPYSATNEDVRPHYRCGNETFHLWDFQTEENPYARLPSCSNIQESLMVYVNYTSFYDLLECDSETEMAIASKISNGYKQLSCYMSASCIMTNYEIHNCNENYQRTRRNINNVYIGYSVTIACNTTKHDTQTCYYGLANAVAEMKSLENNGQSFNILLGNNTYHIKQNQSTSDSWLMCPSGSIANVAFCVPCSIGHYLSIEECLPCSVGTYQLLTGQTFCFVQREQLLEELAQFLYMIVTNQLQLMKQTLVRIVSNV
ncbi:uncharacterized protein [Mytilus edulis]|uniref:uncharacterized protein n=1 Tax=Mytilus edulis TaxID=6550 RepID=UPI0039F08312